MFYLRPCQANRKLLSQQHSNIAINLQSPLLSLFLSLTSSIYIYLSSPETHKETNMVVASVGVSQAIFFSSTTRTTTRNRTRAPSRFDLHPKNPPTSLVLGSSFPLQTNPSRRNRTSHCCRCTPNSNETSLNWDWNRWCRHFSEIEQAESFASVLKVSPPSLFPLNMLSSYIKLFFCV